MSKVEWVRTALAVQASGSITAGAADRGLSQPAASQQLAGLERALGFALFERSRRGVTATSDGERFLREVSTPLEQIEWLLSGLDRGRAEMADLPFVVSCSPEWFEHHAIDALNNDMTMRARFGIDDIEAFDMLRAGRVDLTVTLTRPGSIVGLQAHTLGPRRHLLVAAPALAREPVTDTDALASWIQHTPWVGFSEELPLTRKFWAETTGSVSPTEVRVVLPDVRAVLAAVVAGAGASLVPNDVCAAALDAGDIVEVWEPGLEYAPPPWVITTRDTNHRPEHVGRLVDTLTKTDT